MALQSIRKEMHLPDGEVLAVNLVRIGSYTTGGAPIKVASQFNVVRSAIVQYMGTQLQFLPHIAPGTRLSSIGNPSPGTVKVFVRRPGGTVQAIGLQVASGTVMRGSHHLWLLGQTR